MYFSTNGIGTLMKAFNKLSLYPETCPFFKQQWTAIWLTFHMVVLLILSVTSILISEIMIGWLRREQIFSGGWEIGRAHVCTPVTNAHLVFRLLLENTKHILNSYTVIHM